MKYVFAALLTVSSFAAPAFAADVPQSTLAELGLAGIEIVSDAEGMQVRGMSANAMTMGTSLVSGLLIDPATKSFIFGTDANAAMASAENAGLQVLTQATHTQESAINLSLNVTTLTSTFIGTLVGGAGGSGFASGQ